MSCVVTACSAACGRSEEADALLVRSRLPAAGAAAVAGRTAGSLDGRFQGKPHHLQRRPGRFDRERPLPDLDGRDRARSRRARHRTYRYPDRHAPGLGQQPRRRFADEGPELPRRPEIPRGALRGDLDLGQRRALRGARQAHPPRRHARHRAAVHAHHRRRPGPAWPAARHGARATHHQTTRLRRRPERMGGHRPGRQRGDDRPQRRGRPHEMIGRRALLGAVPALLPPMAAHAQYSPWPDWLGAYAGTLRFYRSIPLEDIYPPPASPSVDRDDRSAFAVQFDIHAIDSVAELWLRIDGGPMQTAERGELLRFGTLVDGVALLASSDARPAPRSATLTVRRDLFSVEALFTHADGSFWRRHFTARFLPDGIDVIVWVFDAAGTRART